MMGRLLVAYSNASNFVSTTAEYLDSFASYSDFEVRYVHVTNDAKLDFNLDEFDAVFQSYCVRLPIDNYVSPDYIEKMKSFRGVKLLAAQDEYENTNKLKTAIQSIGFDVFFTNASARLAERLDPREEFPNTEFITVLTGYVPEALEKGAVAPIPLRERPIHIGYRCRLLPAYYGRLGFEKFEIGRRMRELCEARGIPHDIEWSDEKRLYGDAWYEFTGSCRANLGSETGSNVFDLDGSIRAQYEALTAARGAPVPFKEFCVYTDPIEANFDIGQVSPRIFEAAALSTPLILFSGRYLNLIAPDEHYIELKKDFSNVDAVLERLQDVDGLERMAERTYRHLVSSGEYAYRRFAKLVDDTVARKAEELGQGLRVPIGRSRQEHYNPDAPASLLEFPTAMPRHSAVFFARHTAQLATIYAAEITRLNEVYPAEIARLNAVIAEFNEAYTAEIVRLNEAYPAEIARLNKTYPAEIARLNKTYSTEIARLNKTYSTEIARLNVLYPDEIARLNAALGELDTSQDTFQKS